MPSEGKNDGKGIVQVKNIDYESLRKMGVAS